MGSDSNKIIVVFQCYGHIRSHEKYDRMNRQHRTKWQGILRKVDVLRGCLHECHMPIGAFYRIIRMINYPVLFLRYTFEC